MAGGFRDLLVATGVTLQSPAMASANASFRDVLGISAVFLQAVPVAVADEDIYIPTYRRRRRRLKGR